MSPNYPMYQYNDDRISFVSKRALDFRTTYFPLCGIESCGIKSSITPYLSGDIKLNKEHYLTKPVSTEDLRKDVRNFFVSIKGKGLVSLTSEGFDSNSCVEAGLLWHKVLKCFPDKGVSIEALNFVPVTGENAELMRVRIKNVSKEELEIAPTGVIPIFGRALSNKHDHEHVTSLLHRIEQKPNGVFVIPTMSFDECGHKPNEMVYFVSGFSSDGKLPEGSFPTVESLCKDRGTLEMPLAIVQNDSPQELSAMQIDGKEAVGALRFKNDHLKPGEQREYYLLIGAAKGEQQTINIIKAFDSAQKFDKALENNKKYWLKKSQAIQFETRDHSYDSWMRWVSIQPVLRRIFGCSFLPDHDYGKGGKGWRDIWQDLLSLILIEPEQVRDVLLNNFSGVRIDGSNATIIGDGPGEFVADRNRITRVWMDHGAWPFMTTLLYVQQTGDYDFLLENQSYFKDYQLSRTLKKDSDWDPLDGNKLKSIQGEVFEGSVMEHILVQHLVQFFNVGEHNNIRLECADWNDGLDMARERGESVAFTSLYGGNCIAIAGLLKDLVKAKGIKEIDVAKELLLLVDSIGEKGVDYNSPEKKKARLFKEYFNAVQPKISGETVSVKIADLANDLQKKGEWIFAHIRQNEIVSSKNGKNRLSWFNGYYDNKGEAVEGQKNKSVRMTLTGQVFPILSGAAQEEDIDNVISAVDMYLKDEELKGYRLNTDFGVKNYLDFGRAFGFAYGTKENGAFFSHMTVMYAYGLYHRGFVREGYKVLQSVFNMSRDPQRSKIYPGIPEYFDAQGRGMYHYLTGSASWLVLTQLTQVFGVRGKGGDLVCAPKLVKEEFDEDSRASVHCRFAGKQLKVTYVNASGLDFGEYRISNVLLQGSRLEIQMENPGELILPKEKLNADFINIVIMLDR